MEFLPKHGAWIWSFLTAVLLKAVIVTGTCSFPAALRSQWTRSHDDKVFTFTETAVSGFGFSYFASTIDNFDCLSNTGDQYVLSSDFTSTGGDDFRYLACWEVTEVTTSAFILYELTGTLNAPNISPNAPGIVQPQSNSATTTTDICTIAKSSTFPTTLIKDAATSSDVQVNCPESLFATFTYSQCAGSSMSFCPGRQSVTVDYSTCTTPILNSNDGVLSCMGHFERSPYTYVNLFNHDVGNGVTCMRIQDGGGGAVTAVHYSGDCTTASGASQSLDLTATATCPIGADTTTTATTTTTTTTASTSTTITASTTDTTASGIISQATTSTTAVPEGDSGGDTATASVIVGPVVSVAAVAVIAVVGIIIAVKKNNGSLIKVRDTETPPRSDIEKPLPPLNSVSVTATSSMAPVTTNGDFRFPDLNHSPHRLPPLANVEAPGQPLRA